MRFSALIVAALTASNRSEAANSANLFGDRDVDRRGLKTSKKSKSAKKTKVPDTGSPTGNPTASPTGSPTGNPTASPTVDPCPPLSFESSCVLSGTSTSCDDRDFFDSLDAKTCSEEQVVVFTSTLTNEGDDPFFAGSYEFTVIEDYLPPRECESEFPFESDGEEIAAGDSYTFQQSFLLNTCDPLTDPTDKSVDVLVYADALSFSGKKCRRFDLIQIEPTIFVGTTKTPTMGPTDGSCDEFIFPFECTVTVNGVDMDCGEYREELKSGNVACSESQSIVIKSKIVTRIPFNLSGGFWDLKVFSEVGSDVIIDYDGANNIGPDNDGSFQRTIISNTCIDDKFNVDARVVGFTPTQRCEDWNGDLIPGSFVSVVDNTPVR